MPSSDSWYRVTRTVSGRPDQSYTKFPGDTQSAAGIHTAGDINVETSVPAIDICTADGNPGTWAQVGFQTGDLKATLRNTSDPGWVLAYGQTVNASAGTVYANLYNYANTNSLIGAGKPFSGTQGAFVLPDFRSQAMVGLDNMGGSAKNVISALNALGATTGAATHTLTVSEMPSHDHEPSGGGYAGIWSSNGSVGTNNTTAAGNGMLVINLVNTGGGAAHNIVQPSYGVNIMIKL